MTTCAAEGLQEGSVALQHPWTIPPWVVARLCSTGCKQALSHSFPAVKSPWKQSGSPGAPGCNDHKVRSRDVDVQRVLPISSSAPRCTEPAVTAVGFTSPANGDAGTGTPGSPPWPGSDGVTVPPQRDRDVGGDNPIPWTSPTPRAAHRIPLQPCQCTAGGVFQGIPFPRSLPAASHCQPLIPWDEAQRHLPRQVPTLVVRASGSAPHTGAEADGVCRAPQQQVPVRCEGLSPVGPRGHAPRHMGLARCRPSSGLPGLAGSHGNLPAGCCADK